MVSTLILRGGQYDVEIAGRTIRRIGRIAKAPKGAVVFDLEGHQIMPGMINAHDHLEFNLYPRLGRGPYPNAGAWARDIYHPDESPIREQLRIPKGIRLIWGGLKNLISGVTTVCHHNPLSTAFDRNFPVRVVKRFGWAHSLEFSRDLGKLFRATPPETPFIVHLGEGRDVVAKEEIFRLEELGALDSRTVLVHAVGLDRAGLRVAKLRKASIIWCPSSNLFLFDRTLQRNALASGIPIALGSDSALTAQGDLLDEIAVARKVSGLSNEVLRRMVTVDAARILRLPKGAGELVEGGPADLIAVKDSKQAPALVIVGGQVKLISPSLWRRTTKDGLHPIDVEGRGTFLVDADVPRLREQAQRFLGKELRLAGRRIV